MIILRIVYSTISLNIIQIQEVFNRQDEFNLFKDRKKSTKITRSENRNLQSFGLQHGDLLLLEWNETQNQQDNGINGTNQEKTYTERNTPSIKEDDVDFELEKEDGRTLRPRNEQLCRHGPSGKCVHCVPLEVGLIKFSLSLFFKFIEKYLKFESNYESSIH